MATFDKATGDAGETAVSLIDAKEHCRVVDPQDDARLRGVIRAAEAHVENVLARQLITRTRTLKFDTLPADGVIEICYPPLQSVTTFSYTDSDGNSQNLTETTHYTVDTHSEPGRVLRAYNTTWPTIRTIPHSCSIVYVAGYGAAPASVPASIRHAILLAVSHWWEHREAVTDGNMPELPIGFYSLLSAEGWGRYP